ncbi:hypothetical protein BOTBODRAFT_253591 [Botryobasidium botryosum FD-172 SS1]|uniref:Secreted protein n=1 Tax=Botryobasidium botryosum (strain FD-172 SS1) TaxID=930990 RepID=A0A067M4E8_BOTB1|nr:hypothetical protein BOTBODRAFT_253591 [Botryobasidium botryosum FD-172 SS1]
MLGFFSLYFWFALCLFLSTYLSPANSHVSRFCFEFYFVCHKKTRILQRVLSIPTICHRQCYRTCPAIRGKRFAVSAFWEKLKDFLISETSIEAKTRYTRTRSATKSPSRTILSTHIGT